MYYLYMGTSSLYHTTNSKTSVGCGDRVSQGSVASPPDTADTLIASRDSALTVGSGRRPVNKRHAVVNYVT
jgi:hypothetical protein